MSLTSAGAAFKKALVEETPLQIIGTINANHALLAKRAGFRAIYLSGGGVAAGSLGVPDLGITTLEDVLIDVRRITNICDTPLLVDADTGFGGIGFSTQLMDFLWRLNHGLEDHAQRNFFGLVQGGGNFSGMLCHL